MGNGYVRMLREVAIHDIGDDKMSKKNPNRYYSRKFLNKTEGTAAIEVKADIEGNWTDSHVIITDCYRKVELDFGFSKSNKKTRKERLDKLNLLIDELLKFHSFLCEKTEGE